MQYNLIIPNYTSHTHGLININTVKYNISTHYSMFAGTIYSSHFIDYKDHSHRDEFKTNLKTIRYILKRAKKDSRSVQNAKIINII